MKYQIGWFSTGRDEAARELLKVIQESIEQGEINAQITFVFSNRAPGENRESDLFFELVKSYNIPLIYFSSSKFKPELRKKGLQAEKNGDSDIIKHWRLQYDREVMKRLKNYQPDLGVLAGYMLIIGGELCKKMDLINLHPAAPGGPTGTWQEVIWKLIKARATETGVIMHKVTPELDRGPVVTYCIFPIVGADFDELWQDLNQKLKHKPLSQIITEEDENNPLFKLIRQEGVARELPLIVETIKAFAQGKVKIINGKVVSANGTSLSNGYCLTEFTDRKIKL